MQDQAIAGVTKRVNPSGAVRYFARVRRGGKVFAGPPCSTAEEAAAYLPAIHERASAHVHAQRQKRARQGAPSPEVIYFIQAGTDGPIKIGRTKARLVERRLANLQIASYLELRLLGIMAGDSKAERELHRRFGHLRIRGEWFADDPALREVLRRRPRWLGTQTPRERVRIAVSSWSDESEVA